LLQAGILSLRINLYINTYLYILYWHIYVILDLSSEVTPSMVHYREKERGYNPPGLPWILELTYTSTEHKVVTTEAYPYGEYKVTTSIGLKG